MTIIDLKTMREVSPPPFSVLCLGNFDGVHAGHAALITATEQKKDELAERFPGIVSGACFFRVPPSDYLLASPLPRLTTFDQKLRLFAENGLNLAVVIDFPEVGEYSPKIFANEILRQQCNCQFVVCGFNFRFGKNAAGTIDSLRDFMNGNLSVIQPICVDGQPISSSLIRQAIAVGEVNKIPKMLGRPFSIEAEVVHGKALGRTIGVPTINQYFPGNLAVPKHGIYITRTTINGHALPSVSNVGIRPSIDDGTRVNCETHILDFRKDVYGKCAKVEFLERLRDEIRFDSIDALRAQIRRDILQTQEYYKEARFL